MKKLALGLAVLFILGLVATIVISETSVSTAEKNTYIELNARLTKVNNLLETELANMNAAIEVENQKYVIAVQIVSDTYQPTIDLLRIEIITIEGELEGIK